MSLGKIIDTESNNLSMKIDKQKVPEHVAIIMDGNGRWATKKGLPRTYGHEKGVSVLKEILKSSKKLGCKILTVYAFSTENWTRPTKEVEFLINLIGNQNTIGTNKTSLGKNSLSQNTKSSDNIVSNSNEKETEKPAIFFNKND